MARSWHPQRRRGKSVAKKDAALSDEEASDYESAPPVKSSRNSASRSVSDADDASTKPRKNGRAAAAKKDLKEVDDDVDIDEDADVKDADEEDEEDEEGLEDDVYGRHQAAALHEVQGLTGCFAGSLSKRSRST